MSFLTDLFEIPFKSLYRFDFQIAPWRRAWKRTHKDSTAVPVCRSKYKTPHQGRRECERRLRQRRSI